MFRRWSGWVVALVLSSVSSFVASAQVVDVAPAPFQDGVVYFNTGPVAVADLLNLLDDPSVVFEADAAHVLMLDGPITTDRRGALEAIGVQLFDYLPKHAYVARLGGVNAGALRGLGFVTYVGPFRDEWKLDLELFTRAYESEAMQAIVAADRRPVVVTIFANVDPIEAVNTINGMAGAVIHRAEPLGEWFEIAAEIPTGSVASLARLGSVQYVEPAGEYTLRNSSNRWIVQSNVTNVTPLYANGIHGEGQIVGVLDGKADRQHCSLSGTKILFYNTSESPDDTHGTHVSCTAVGNAGVDDNTRGVAYMGSMVFNTIPAFTEASVNTALTTHSNQGARMHTNSWGDDGTTSYNSMCRGFDLFGYQHEDDIVCLAVTNTGTLRNPENAKNLLAVGASQDTPSQANHCSGGTGPTADSRRKPEIYAPGCGTTSATPDGCGTTSLTGTSMASPAVAGTAALVRQYYVNGYYPTGTATGEDGFLPSGALIKATLLNSAADMTGITGYPSNQEGWGRVLADNALFFPGDARKLAVLEDVRNASGLSTTDEETYSINVLSSGQQLRVTLVWCEPAASASTGSASASINDLDLEVISPGGTTYLGNVFSGGVSVSGGTKDPRNNVEQVHLNSPAVGIWTVRVIGANVAQGTQGYALIATGDAVEVPETLSIILPDGAPESLTPGVATNFNVLIVPGSQTLAPGTAQLFYSYDGGAYENVPLTPAGGNNFVATLPPALCAENPRFYVRAEGSGGAIVTSPSDAPGIFHSAIVGTYETRFSDNFQTNQLWSVADTPSGGGTFTGTWQRGTPVVSSAAPSSDADGSGQCYVTALAATVDIDNGSTTLSSPAIDLTGLATAEVSYARWYSNSTGAAGQADTMVVQVSSNNGFSWTALETVGPTTGSPNPEVSGGWFTKTYSIDSVVPLTNQFRIRFTASDLGAGSYVEAALDAVVVRGFACVDPVTTPAAPTGVAASGGESCAAVSVIWNASTGADDYEVWRNTVDDSGTATPIATALVGMQFDDATAEYGQTYFYWVKACNGVGCSGYSASDAGHVALAGDFTGDGEIDGSDVQGFADANVTSPFYDDCADLVTPFGILDPADIDAFVAILLAP